MNLLTAAVPLFEIALLLLACYVYFRRRNYNVTESFTFGVLALLVLLSLVYQSAFLLRMPALAYPIEAILLIFSVYQLVQHRDLLRRTFYTAGRWLDAHRFSGAFLFIAWGYLFAVTLFIPPNTYDSMKYNLARILLFQEADYLFLQHATSVLQLCSPLGHDILHHAFLRFYNDYGIGVFSFLEYLAVGAGVYAVARRFTSPQYAWTAAISAWGLPLLVYQATSTKNDLVLALCVLATFIAWLRLLERPNTLDTMLLLFALIFGVGAKVNFSAFAIPALLLMLPALVYRHGLHPWYVMLRRRWGLWIILVFALFLLSGVWFLAYNYARWHNPFGPSDYINSFRNHDGMTGAVANLIRYLFQSIHFLQITEEMSRSFLHFSLVDILQDLYNLLIMPIFSDAGVYSIFRISWESRELVSWFGPLGVLLVIPALLYTLIRGEWRWRILCIALLSYVALLCYQVIWLDFNGRFFTLFFAPACISVGFLLQNLNTRRGLINIVCILSIFTLYYAAIFNTKQPLITEKYIVYLAGKWSGISDISNKKVKNLNIWEATDWGRNREFYAINYYGGDHIEIFRKFVLNNMRVGLLSMSHDCWVYHYLISRPDIQFIPLPHTYMVDGSIDYEHVKDLDYLVTLYGECTQVKGHPGIRRIWAAPPNAVRSSLVDLKAPAIMAK